MKSDEGPGLLMKIGFYSFLAGAGLWFLGGAAAARRILDPLPPLFGLLLAAAVLFVVTAVSVALRGAPFGDALRSSFLGTIGMIILFASGLSLSNQHFDTSLGEVYEFSVRGVIPRKVGYGLAVRLADGRDTSLSDIKGCLPGSNGAITLRPGALRMTWIEGATCGAPLGKPADTSSTSFSATPAPRS